MTKMVCIKKGKWVRADGRGPVTWRCPNYNEIVEVEGSVPATPRAPKAYLLVGYNDRVGDMRVSFVEQNFRPLNDSSQYETRREETGFDFRKSLTKEREDA